METIVPLTPQTTPVAPTALYSPQILLQTSIVGGRLVTSATILLAGANVGEEDTWSATGPSASIHLSNIEHLETDLAGLQSDVNSLYATIVQLIGNLNSIRKVL